MRAMRGQSTALGSVIELAANRGRLGKPQFHHVRMITSESGRALTYHVVCQTT